MDTAVKRTYLEYGKDRSIYKCVMINGEVVSRKKIEGQKMLSQGTHTLDFGIKKLKRSGAPKKLIREYKEGVWGEYRKRVEKQLEKAGAV